MKSYKTEAVAKCQASKLTNKGNGLYIYTKDGDVFTVGTFDEITEMENKKAKSFKIEVREMSFNFVKETPFWLIGEKGNTKVWFEKASLAYFNIVEATKELVVAATSKYFDKKFPATA